jgi:hypothetical protein
MKNKIVIDGKILPVAIAGSILLIGLVVVGVFVFFNKSNSNNSTTAANSRSTASRNGRTPPGEGGFGGPGGGTMDYTQFCTMQKNRPQQDSNGNQNTDSNFQQMQATIDKVCADGTVSSSEQTELEQLFQNMPQPNGDPNQNGGGDFSNSNFN